MTLIAMVIGVFNIAADTSPNGYDYDIIENGMYYRSIKKTNRDPKIVAYELTDADYIENLVIPDSINGLPVQGVSNFKGRVDIENVSLGAFTKYFDFSDCIYIKNIDTSRLQVETNGSGYCRFDRCIGIQEVVLSPNAYVRFNNCTSLKKVTIQGGRGDLGFSYCTALTDVILDDSITQVPDFSGCSSLKSITIPIGAKSIGNFSDCTSLETVIIPDESLFESVPNSCFSNTNISSINLPDCVTSIGYNAFENTRLEEFKFPKGCTNASPNYIFVGCTNLKRLVYCSLDQLFAIPPGFDEYKGFGGYLEQSNNRVEVYIGQELLTDLTVPQSMNAELMSFMAYTSGLKSVEFENRTGSHYFSRWFQGIQTLETVNVGAGATNFELTFSGCTNLNKVIFSEKNRAERMNYAFNACRSLKEITIPALTKLIFGNFSNCTSLETVNIPNLTILDGSENFENCTSLQNIVFPNLTKIEGYNNFTGCASLLKADLPVLTVFNRPSTFSGCSALEEVNIPLYSGKIMENTFEDCTSLKKVNVGAITHIGDEAFMNCTSLEHFDFSAIEYIGYSAFMNSGLKSIAILNSLKEINSGVFQSCASLESADIRGILDIPERTFEDCHNLTEIKLSNDLNTIGDNAFYATGLVSVVIPESVNNLGRDVFRKCENLENIVLPPMQAQLSSGIIWGCKKIKSLIIPEGITGLSYWIVGANDGLEYLSVPKTVCFIDGNNSLMTTSNSFNFSTSPEILFWSSVPPVANSANTRFEFEGHTIHVPVGCASFYKEKNSFIYANIIDDLMVTTDFATNGTNLLISLPDNSNANLSHYKAPNSYVVDCYEYIDEESEEFVRSILFSLDDSEDKRALRTATNDYYDEIATDGKTLNISELKESTNYRFDIKGYTSEGHLIYHENKTIHTGVTSGVESIGSYPNLRLMADGFWIGENLDGEILMIHTIDGREVRKEKAIGNTIMNLDLQSGIYVVTIGDYSAKFQVK